MIELQGLWLLGALVLALLVGVFTSQYIKDVLKGVPSSLRSALKTTEANALASLKTAEAKAISDVVGMLPTTKVVVAGAASTIVTDAKAAVADIAAKV